MNNSSLLISDPEKLTHINKPEYNIAVWRRTQQADNGLYCALLASQPERIAIYCHYTSVADSLQLSIQRSLSEYNISDAVNFFKDVQLLADTFYQISGSKQLKLYFSVVHNDMCRRFNTDINDLRLLCTYWGAGTLWLNDHTISEQMLDAAMEQPEILTNHICRAGTGDVVILKGALHTTARGNAVLHRSPAIEEHGNKRILLRLDTNIMAWDY
ncbi:MAG: DUF1826 domain-containing protein [Ferruginibacter sp.]